MRPDLVHTTLFEADIAGRIAARLAGVPVVSSLVSLAYGPEQLRNSGLVGWRVRGAQALDGVTARGVIRFHAVTAHVADVMSRRLRIPKRKIDVVPRGRDPEGLGVCTRERREAARRSLGLPSDGKLLLAVARHEYSKGLDTLIDAFDLVHSALPTARLLIAGKEGNATPSLRQALLRLRSSAAVELAGNRDDVPELLCAADTFVFPSRWEGLPGAVLEAMALKAPIVASDIPAVRETLPSQGALLVPPERPESLARAIVRALSDADAAARRAEVARARFAEMFTIDRVSEGMLSFYRRALGDGT